MIPRWPALKILATIPIGIGIVAACTAIFLVLLLVTSIHNWPASWSYIVGGDNHGCRTERVVHVHADSAPNYIVTLSDGRSYQRDVDDTETYGGDCGRGPCRFHPGDSAFVCPTRYRDKGGVELVRSPGDMDYPNDFTYQLLPSRRGAKRSAPPRPPDLPTTLHLQPRASRSARRSAVRVVRP